MLYEPQDFQEQKAPGPVCQTYFERTLGKTEYETLAGCVIAESQEQGNWTQVHEDRLTPYLRKAIPRMVQEGYLTRDDQTKEVMLTDAALKIIADRGFLKETDTR